MLDSDRFFGGPDRDRTDDLFHAMEARSQLRHRPTLVGCNISIVTVRADFVNSALPAGRGQGHRAGNALRNASSRADPEILQGDVILLSQATPGMESRIRLQMCAKSSSHFRVRSRRREQRLDTSWSNGCATPINSTFASWHGASAMKK